MNLMRYCHNCHRITAGEALFCHHCGSSFDAKLCPSRHVNPRWAIVCSHCGSRDLSTPAPRRPLWLAPLIFILTLLPGFVLALVLVMLLVALITSLLTNQQVQLQLLMLILVFSILWFAYIHVPHFIRDLFRSIWRRKKKDRHTH